MYYFAGGMVIIQRFRGSCVWGGVITCAARGRYLLVVVVIVYVYGVCGGCVVRCQCSDLCSDVLYRMCGCSERGAEICVCMIKARCGVGCIVQERKCCEIEV